MYKMYGAARLFSRGLAYVDIGKSHFRGCPLRPFIYNSMLLINKRNSAEITGKDTVNLTSPLFEIELTHDLFAFYLLPNSKVYQSFPAEATCKKQRKIRCPVEAFRWIETLMFDPTRDADAWIPLQELFGPSLNGNYTQYISASKRHRYTAQSLSRWKCPAPLQITEGPQQKSFFNRLIHWVFRDGLYQCKGSSQNSVKVAQPCTCCKTGVASHVHFQEPHIPSKKHHTRTKSNLIPYH